MNGKVSWNKLMMFALSELNFDTMFRRFIYFIFSVFSIILLVQCKKTEIDSDGSITFSTDTVSFDTIFSTIGSTTTFFKIYNPNNTDLKISKIHLGNSHSMFRLNIDGYNKNSIENLIIPANDSLFVFVEVTVNPTNSNSPMVILDSVIFQMEKHSQNIKLQAFGQDVHLINGQIFKTDTTWTNDKPYLIYNSMLVDSLTSLTIEEGCRLHFHHHSGMYIKGQLIVKGTKDNPVLFQGDRLEYFYDDIPGQWDRIAFLEGSFNNKINYAIIKNGVIGIQTGSLAINNKPSVEIKNTEILNMNYAGLYSLGGGITAENTIVSNCGFYEAALLIGGNYQFNQCTFVNFWKYANRSEPSIVLTNFLLANNTYYLGNLSTAFFGNCIIYGSLDDEIGFGKDNTTEFNYQFKNCLITYKKTDISDTNHFQNIITGDAKLVDYTKNDFHLMQESPCIDAGDKTIGNTIPTDLDEIPRTTDSAPDLGAFEYSPN